MNVQAHGGWRQGVGSECTNCHTKGAVDRTVGSKGIACTTNAQCPGIAAGWETCQDTNGDTILDACVITVDPTPNQSIDFGVLLHAIHYSRLRDGYAERNNLVAPGVLSAVGFNNGADDVRHGSVPAGRAQLQDLPRRRRRHLLGGETVRHRSVVRRRHVQQRRVADALDARLHFLPR